MDLTVVTAIFGKGFQLYEPAEPWPGCRFVCFTDQPLESNRWIIVPHETDLSPRRGNRYIKTLTHRFVEGPTLYVDAEFKIVSDPTPVARAALESSSIGMSLHPSRTCLYQEAAYCVRKNVTKEVDLVHRQIKRYKRAGMPRDFGLWAGCIIARRGDADSDRLGEAWWSELEQGCERDQISLPFASWKLGMRPETIPGTYTAMDWVARRKA